MALNNFSTDLWVVNLNGRDLTDWGETSPPYTDDEIDPPSVLRRGQGGNAVRLDRINPGRSVTLNLQPGSPDSAYVNALMISKADITIGARQVGTLEAKLGSEGCITSKGSAGRGGADITDDVYTIELNLWTETAGGE
jgi:hypothetical protein